MLVLLKGFDGSGSKTDTVLKFQITNDEPLAPGSSMILAGLLSKGVPL